MEEDKPVEESAALPIAELNEEENVLRDSEGTSGLHLGQEGTSRPDVIPNLSGALEPPYSSSPDSETGEILKDTSIWSVPRLDLISNIASSEESNEVVEAETTSVSKGKFKIRSVPFGEIPAIKISEVKDDGSDEIVAKNPTSVTIEADTSAELDCWKFSSNLMSRTVSTASDDTLPDHGVYVSEESSISSLDVSHGISNMRLTESVDSGLKVPAIESPPPSPTSKRKLSDSDSSTEEWTDISPKKVRITYEPEEMSGESSQMAHELQGKSVVVDVESTCLGADGTETEKGPTVEFPEDSEDCSKSERGSKKRTQSMTLCDVEDVTDTSPITKRIKQDD